nr:hypothetical protein [uncultured Pseudomonas sp.]
MMTNRADILAKFPSPTAGMTLGQRIEFVGGRLTDSGLVEFGSLMVVDMLMLAAIRDRLLGQERYDTSPIVERIELLERRHGSLRAAARATGIETSYLFRLKNSEKLNPSDDVLAALGLERVTYYRRKEEEE